jgi:hypothetical protein
MFNSINTYFYRLRTDSQARRNLFITIGLAIGLVAFVSLVVYATNRDRTISDGLINDDAFVIDYDLVTPEDFDISQGLEQQFGVPVATAQAIGVNNGNWAYVNEDFLLSYNGQTIEGSPIISPRSVYVTDGGGAILNGLSRTYLYDGTEVSPFIERATSVVPSLITNNQNERSTEGYMFIFNNNDQIFIFEAEELLGNVSVNQVAQFNLRDGKNFAELRVFNNEPYLFVYSSINRVGDVDVWQINSSNRIVKSQELTDVESISFSDFGFMYTTFAQVPTELSVYESFVVNYSNNVLGEIEPLDILPSIAQNGIFGTLYAERCSMDSRTSITCLMKIRKVVSSDYTEQDKIIRYDFLNDEITYPYDGVFLSGVTILYDDNFNPYIIGQENNVIYQLDQNFE